MILDSEIPTIGSSPMTKIWRKVQDTLLHGGPLLVDANGRPATELRRGGFLQEPVSEWNELLVGGSRLVDANGKRIADPYQVDQGAYFDLPGRAVDFAWTEKKTALLFSLDYPYQVVSINRADLPKMGRLEAAWDRLLNVAWRRPRWALEGWLERHRNADAAFSFGWDLYRHGRQWSLDIYLGPLVFEFQGDASPQL